MGCLHIGRELSLQRRRRLVEDRPAVEPDHVGELSRSERGPALSQPDAAEKSEKIEGAVVVHLAQGLVVREILHPHHHALAEAAEAGGESPESLRGELLELRERGRLKGSPVGHSAHHHLACAALATPSNLSRSTWMNGGRPARSKA